MAHSWQRSRSTPVEWKVINNHCCNHLPEGTKHTTGIDASTRSPRHKHQSYDAFRTARSALRLRSASLSAFVFSTLSFICTVNTMFPI